jgi:ubiquinone/menaquinone biosynthesis C-methylase UbiE
MLRKAEQRVQQNGWTNVQLLDMEYGIEPVTRGRADVVLFSYSLSMIEHWRLALACTYSELRPGGRIGILDLCKTANASQWFAAIDPNARNCAGSLKSVRICDMTPGLDSGPSIYSWEHAARRDQG